MFGSPFILAQHFLQFSLSCHQNYFIFYIRNVKAEEFYCIRFIRFSRSFIMCLHCTQTGSDQHNVWFWSSNSKIPGCEQVHLLRRLRGSSSDVDRVSSVAGGGSRPGPGLAAGNPTHACS